MTWMRCPVLGSFAQISLELASRKGLPILSSSGSFPIHSFGPTTLTFSLGQNGGGPVLVGFCRFGTWILKSSPVLVRFASGPCDPSVLGYLCYIPKLGHCRFECCLWWRCRRLIAFGRLIPRSLLLAWGLRELHVLVLCHLA